MKRVSDIMSSYFDEEPKLIVEKKLPVKPKRSEWEYVKDPEVCLSAKFSFENASLIKNFAKNFNNKAFKSEDINRYPNPETEATKDTLVKNFAANPPKIIGFRVIE